MSIDKSLVKNRDREDGSLDATLRPERWDEFVGQEHAKKNLKILLEAAQKRRESIEHVLLSGPAGLGKTSLAHLIAREMNTNIRVTSGPAIEKAGDLAAILTNLLPQEILFIDEVHRLNKLVEEVLYPAMESRTLDIIIGKGPSARTIQLDLPPFTLVAATTRIGLLSSPLRSRFGASFRLDFYDEGEIGRILSRSARILEVGAEKEALELLARASRSVPRIANRLLKRCRDYAQVHAQGLISGEVAQKTLALLEVDQLGLDRMDRRILRVIIEKFSGGPVGLQAIAAAASEEEDTLEEVYEPFLMQLGFLERTPRGRLATEKAYKYLGLKTGGQKTLLT